MPLRLHIACPAPAGSTLGNRVTALRWAALLRELGHRARVVCAHAELPASPPDVCVALHAKKSAAAVREFRERWPERPLVVVLTGTDLNRDLARGDREARTSLALADRVVVLQPLAIEQLPTSARAKAVVILPSVELPAGVAARRVGAARGGRARARRSRHEAFAVCVLAHLRREKDPLRAAFAARELPASSRVRVVLLGRALDQRLARTARAEERRNPRFRWLGERSRRAALRELASSRLCVLSSLQEGASNALAEALALGVGVLATRIASNVGLLGARHPGLFAVGDTRGLLRLIARAEDEPAFLARLERASRALAPRFARAREREAWRALLAELVPGERGDGRARLRSARAR